MVTQAAEKRLYRSRTDALIAGVCAGIAERFELDSIVVRILAVLLACLTFGVAAVVYVVMWVRVPLAPESSLPYDIRPESAESSAFGCVDCEGGWGRLEPDRMGDLPLLARLAIATGIMLLFLAVAVNISPYVPGTEWWQFWPVLPLMAGLSLIVIPIRSRWEMAWHAAGIVLTAASASVLPMALGVMSWETVPCAFERLWPVVALVVALTAVGIARKMNTLVLVGALCFVVFCVMAITLCVVPGALELLMFQSPSGRSIQIAVIR